ncbi:U3 small nucleolar RNA-associated protein 25 homolog [Narcine bancroftii]|uniref:U3 small nucleolar RNA-associated protein 25 homolog n=1 Tax=Narcine bancroftii TaxID=1343680 RepID=UPI00383203E4
MGKRKSGKKLKEMVGSLTKKQKKHLKEFGEEHPFHDKISDKVEPIHIVELFDSSGQSDSEGDAVSELKQVTAYQHLCSTLKNIATDESDSESELEGKAEDTKAESELVKEYDTDDNDVDDKDQEEDAFNNAEAKNSTTDKNLDAEIHGNEDANDTEADFTDVKNEAKFCLESNYDDENEVSFTVNSEDPFKQHVDKELDSNDLKILTQVKGTMQSKWNSLGQLIWSSPLLKETSIKELSCEYLKNLHLQKPLEATWPKLNRQTLTKAKLKEQRLFTSLQQGLFSIMNAYKDLYYPERTATQNGEEVRHTYCLHVINHVLKANSQVLNNNTKNRERNADDDGDDLRDRGLARPKVLIVVPFRDSVLRVVQTLIGLLDVKDKMEISNKKRFRDEYGCHPDDKPPNLKRPEDYEAIFAGNVDDHFRIGVAILRRSIRLYAPFYSSDIIIASPLGLRTIIKSEDDKTSDFDFLSSIEILIIDQADVYLMQNWEHVLHLMKHLNHLPRESHGVDFSRVRVWCLNNWSKYYRQTLIFSALQNPQINSIYNKHCFNYKGQVAVRNMPQTGSICHVVVQLPHVFQRVDVSSFTELTDTRFEFFTKKILPQYREAVMSHTLIYVPSYFDYVRLRNYFNHEELNSSHICEYSKRSTVDRARYQFLKGEKSFLLFTERFHFYKRYTIKGIRHLIFYELPTYPHFYSDICNMLKAENRGDEASWTCTVLYSKYDAQKLIPVVGVERAAHMMKSNKSIHLFVTGDDL